MAEVWSAEEPSITRNLEQPEHFADAAGWNWYPFMALLPHGPVLWWGDTAGSITDAEGENPTDLPPLPKNIKYRTMYPYTATPLLLALSPKDDYQPKMVIFGGAPDGADDETTAASTSLRLDMFACDSSPNGYCSKNWQVESMLGIPRVMGDSVLLPNGKVVLLSGAKKGRAAYGYNPAGQAGQASSPNTLALLYDPEAAMGKRYKVLGPTHIIRLYHSAACLHHTGEVVVAGCDTCAHYKGKPEGVSFSPNGPLEYRLQLVVPPYIAADVPRPTIIGAPKTITRGQTFSVQYSYSLGKIKGASLAAPCATTHSINMNQRVVMLELEDLSDDTAVLAAPPANLPALAVRGYYLLFLLGEDGSYSEGKWIKLK